jgi:hypothetical protein
LLSRKAVTLGASSNLFFIENASAVEGNMDEAISALVRLMEIHGLSLLKTANQSEGLIGKDDVLIIEVNCQWPSRGGTNTDLVKSLIQEIVNHPEGFIGEIVVADNGQGYGSLNWASSNAFNHGQSMQDIVDMFPAYNVSTWLWDTIRMETVHEYDQGDFNDGYVVNSTQNPNTGLHVSYPKFKTKYGTYISFKKGVWEGSSYNSERLKVINVPVLKSHWTYGVTASIKNYMGVVTNFATASHSSVARGGMGTAMSETRLPILNILDCVWVNANPEESGNAGPATSYEDASFTDVIGASQDPVAIDYWASKHVLIPAAMHKGYTEYSSLDPDYEPVTPGLGESYHNYLERSMNELENVGYRFTMNEAEMNVYVSPARVTHDVAVLSVEPSVTQVNVGETVYICVDARNEGTLSEIFNTTETFNVTAYYRLLSMNTAFIPIETQTVTDLELNENVSLIFSWSTTDKAIGNYSIKAETPILPGETDAEDNTMISTSTVKVIMLGDINGDFKIDILDISIAALAFGSFPDHSRWNELADINQDGKVDIRDLALIAINFGDED